MIGFGDPVFNLALEGPADRRATAKVAARSIATIAYTDFWRGAASTARGWRNGLTPPTS